MDEECNYHTFQRLMEDKEKWAQVQDPASEGYAIYQGMMAGLICFVDNLWRFQQQIIRMTEILRAVESEEQCHLCRYVFLFLRTDASYWCTTS